MTKADISSVSPFFIERDGAAALSFYCDQLGFAVTCQEPADEPFFGIVCRGGAMIVLKSVGVAPLPNYKRELAARWDGYLYVPDPDALAAEFIAQRQVFRSTQGLVARAARRASLRSVGVHVLRHTFCSHLAMRGAGAKAIQELAGHRDLSTTQRYMHVSPAAVENAIRLLDSPAFPMRRETVGKRRAPLPNHADK